MLSHHISAFLPAVLLLGALVSTTSREIEPTGRYLGILGLSVFKGYRVTIDLRRPHVRPEALLQTIVVPVASAAVTRPGTTW